MYKNSNYFIALHEEKEAYRKTVSPVTDHFLKSIYIHAST